MIKRNYRNKKIKEIKPTLENLTFISPNLLSINVAKNYIFNFKFAAKKRIENTNYLKERLSKNHLWDEIIFFEKGCIPYLFGIKFNDKKLAEKMYNLLTNNEFLVMRWPDLPYEINEINNQLKKRCMNRVSQTLFFFIHQNLNQRKWINKIERILEQNNLID